MIFETQTSYFSHLLHIVIIIVITIYRCTIHFILIKLISNDIKLISKKKFINY